MVFPLSFLEQKGGEVLFVDIRYFVNIWRLIDCWFFIDIHVDMRYLSILDLDIHVRFLLEYFNTCWYEIFLDLNLAIHVIWDTWIYCVYSFASYKCYYSFSNHSSNYLPNEDQDVEIF